MTYGTCINENDDFPFSLLDQLHYFIKNKFFNIGIIERKLESEGSTESERRNGFPDDVGWESQIDWASL